MSSPLDAPLTEDKASLYEAIVDSVWQIANHNFQKRWGISIGKEMVREILHAEDLLLQKLEDLKEKRDGESK